MMVVNGVQKGRFARFVAGLAAWGRAFRTLVVTPRLWGLVALPAVLFTVVLAFVGWRLSSWELLDLSTLEQSASSVKAWGLSAARVLLQVLAWLLAILVAGLVTPMISGPILEKLSERYAAMRGLDWSRSCPFWRGLSLSLRAQALATVAGVATWLLSLWVKILIGPFAVLLLPIDIVVQSSIYAFVLIDVPWSLKGVPIRGRLSTLGHDWPSVLGLGLPWFLLALLPCCTGIALPLGVLAATEWTVSQRDDAKG